MKLRPTRTIPLSVPRDEAIERMRARVAEVVPANNYLGKGRWCEIHLPAEERRVWTPHLSLRVDHGQDGGSSVFVRFAPKPEIWTLFVFAYSLLSFAALFAATLGYVQWASDESAWGFTVALGSVAGIVLLHLASLLGQRLSEGQTRALLEQLEQVVAGLPATPAPVPSPGGGAPGDAVRSAGHG